MLHTSLLPVAVARRLRKLFALMLFVFLLIWFPSNKGLAAPCELDASFGFAGVTTTDFDGRFDQANAIAIQKDKKMGTATIRVSFGTFTITDRTSPTIPVRASRTDTSSRRKRRRSLNWLLANRSGGSCFCEVARFPHSE